MTSTESLALLTKLAADCSRDGWDGYGATAVSAGAVANAARLIHALLHPLMTAQLRVHDLDLDGLLSGEARSARNAEAFGREDVEWGLHGRE